MTIRGVISIAASVVFAACGGGLDLPRPALLERVGASDNQVAVAGNRLERPLAVRVTTSDGATVVPRAEVRWEVVEGMGAVLSDSVTVADGAGEAQVVAQLGPEEGSYAIRATLVEESSQTAVFNAIATTPPRLTGVVPASFGGGDTLRLSGTGLTTDVSIEVAGRPARVIARSVTQTALTALAPACLVPGPVLIAARVGLASSQLAADFFADEDMLELAPGEHLTVDPVALSDCATFPSADPSGAEYLLAPQSVSGTPGENAVFRLVGDAAITTGSLTQPSTEPRSFALDFHDYLRELEAELSREPRVPYQPEAILGARQAEIQVGHRRSFKVCNTVTCSAVEDFSTVTAEAKYVGEHAVLYIDLDAPTAGLSETDFNALGSIFDADLYGVNASAFGAESDVDRNGLVFILLTPVVNKLTPPAQCPTSFITGFFFSLDTDPNRVSDPRSNQAEMFYGIVPDPAGTVTCNHSVDRVRRIVPITFTHELQHLINFYQHTILRAGQTELTWLNEAMSHVAEELGGFHFRSKGDSVRFSSFVTGNLFNAFQFLSAPQAHMPLFNEGTGTLAERGAGWLFLRWVVDQFGASTLRRLSETKLVGEANIANAVGEPLQSLLSDWFLANYVSNLPDLTTSSRLQYSTWDFRDVYQSLNNQAPEQFDRPFPILPQNFTGGSFDLSGFLQAGSGDYVRVTLPGNVAGFTVQLVDGAGNPLSGTVVPRLNVIRLR